MEKSVAGSTKPPGFLTPSPWGLFHLDLSENLHPGRTKSSDENLLIFSFLCRAFVVIDVRRLFSNAQWVNEDLGVTGR
ncbi:MAG: hypothetical protein WB930_00910 [Syntrophobacteraceae bacterium]